MTYNELIQDLDKLTGIELRSIKAGANITLISVDMETDRLELKTSTGQLKSRPLSEIKRIWEDLSIKPAVHVDKVLAGSGSSRNQPETMLANLPYIEWLRFESKKHLCFVGKPTHSYGTIKQMDGVDAEKVRALLRQQSSICTQCSMIIVVSHNLQDASNQLERITGISSQSLEAGIYSFNTPSSSILLISKSILNSDIPAGTYTVTESRSIPINCKNIKLLDRTFHFFNEADVSLMLVQK